MPEPLDPQAFRDRDWSLEQFERRQEQIKFRGPHLNIKFSAPTLERLYGAMVMEKRYE